MSESFNCPRCEYEMNYTDKRLYCYLNGETAEVVCDNCDEEFKVRVDIPVDVVVLKQG